MSGQHTGLFDLKVNSSSSGHSHCVVSLDKAFKFSQSTQVYKLGSCELSGRANRMLGVILCRTITPIQWVGGGGGSIVFLLGKPKPNTSLMDHKAPD